MFLCFKSSLICFNSVSPWSSRTLLWTSTLHLTNLDFWVNLSFKLSLSISAASLTTSVSLYSHSSVFWLGFGSTFLFNKLHCCSLKDPKCESQHESSAGKKSQQAVWFVFNWGCLDFTLRTRLNLSRSQLFILASDSGGLIYPQWMCMKAEELMCYICLFIVTCRSRMMSSVIQICSLVTEWISLLYRVSTEEYIHKTPRYTTYYFMLMRRLWAKEAFINVLWLQSWSELTYSLFNIAWLVYGLMFLLRNTDRVSAGSGKSYTMMGSAEQPGLIPRLCSSLFSRTVQEAREGESFTVEVSYMEIYNEKVRDLLDPKGWGTVQPRWH